MSYSVTLVNGTKPETIFADSFTIDEHNNLNFWDRELRDSTPVAVFSSGHWQFFEEVE